MEEDRENINRENLYRGSNPFRGLCPSETLDSKGVDQWIETLYSGRLNQLKGIFNSSKELYDATPNQLIEKSKTSGKSETLFFVLYRQIHLWEAPKPDQTTLIERIGENPDMIYQLSMRDIQRIIENPHLKKKLQKKRD